MFSALRENSPLYILDESGRPSLTVGQVSSVSNSVTGNAMGAVDITVYADGRTLSFNQLPAWLSVARSGKDGLIVADSKDAMLKEVDGLMAASQKAIDDMDRHKTALEEYGKMLAVLDPASATRAEQERRISAIEDKLTELATAMSGMSGTVSDMLGRLMDKKEG